MTKIKRCPPLADYLSTSQADYLRGLMSRYTVDNLAGISPDEFQEQCEEMAPHWGHNHDFGAFQMKGAMGDRHISVLAAFMREFELTQEHFCLTNVMDIGCWSGGTLLLFREMNAVIKGYEPRWRHFKIAKMLCRSFDIRIGLENFLHERWGSPSCFVYCAGVIYHAQDPLDLLTYWHRKLGQDGLLLLESAVCGATGLHCEYRGKGSGGPSGPNYFIPTAECMAKWMVDVGFAVDKVTFHGRRALAVGRK